MILERRGVPAAVVCTDAFRAPADAMAEVQGAPGYRYVTTPHPLAILTPEQVRERAEEALPEVVALLVARSVDSPHEIRTPPPRFRGDPEEGS